MTEDSMHRTLDAALARNSGPSAEDVEVLAAVPLDPPCPDCGNDPDDGSLHHDNCRRVFPVGHPLERLQFGPPYVAEWEPWTRSHWTELEEARRG
jgi:hypothetical protein